MAASASATSSPSDSGGGGILTYPEKFYAATAFVDAKYGDLEANKELETGCKLAMYAVRMQAEKGPCKEPAPYMWNVTERYKHSAWSHLGRMSQFEAMVKYVQILEEICGKEWADTVTEACSPTRVQPEGAKAGGKGEGSNEEGGGADAALFSPLPKNPNTLLPAPPSATVTTAATTMTACDAVSAEDTHKALQKEVERLRRELATVTRERDALLEANAQLVRLSQQTHQQRPSHQQERATAASATSSSSPFIVSPPVAPALSANLNVRPPSFHQPTAGAVVVGSSPMPLPLPPPAVPPSSRYHALLMSYRKQQQQSHLQHGTTVAAASVTTTTTTTNPTSTTSTTTATQHASSARGIATVSATDGTSANASNTNITESKGTAPAAPSASVEENAKKKKNDGSVASAAPVTVSPPAAVSAVAVPNTEVRQRTWMEWMGLS